MSSMKSSYELLHQGSVLSESIHETVLHECIDQKPKFQDGDRMIVVSQDCDIVAPAKNEPFIELITAKVCQKPDSGKMHGKSTRYLAVCAGTIFLEICVHDRFRVPKEKVDWSLDNHFVLSEAAVEVFKGWLARRYRRAAFPNEFEKRIRQKQHEMDTLLRGDEARTISAVFLKTSREELPKDQSYHLTVLLAIEVADANSSFENALESILNSCEGIIVDDINSMLEKDITLGLLREFRRWNKDFYSSAEDSGSAHSVED